jgi:hypothetical protein
MSSSKKEPPKSLGELLSDPHFIFTILSLIMSLCVFLYYLFQLMFRTDWKATTPTKDRTAVTSRDDRFRKLNSSQNKNPGAPKQPTASVQAQAGKTSGGSSTAEQELAAAEEKAAELLSRIQARMAANKMGNTTGEPGAPEPRVPPPAPEPLPKAKPSLSSMIDDDDDEPVDLVMNAKSSDHSSGAAAKSGGLRHRRPAAKVDSQ